MNIPRSNAKQNARSTTLRDRFAHSEMVSLTEQHVRYDLAESVSKDLTLIDILSETDYKKFASTPLEYSSAAGNPQLRAAIAARYSNVCADDVVITQGGMHSLFLIGQILGCDGGEFLIHEPGFPLTMMALQSDVFLAKRFTSNFNNHYQIKPADLRLQLSSLTKLVCIENPRNPSGVSVSSSTIVQLLTVLREQCPNAFLLVDETYREARYSVEPAKSSAIELDGESADPRLVISGSLSKSHGAPGLRLGWVITRNNWLREQLVRGKFQTIIANGTLDELLALIILQQEDSILLPRQEQLAQGKALVKRWVNDHSEFVLWIEPDAGALCCVCLREDKFNATAVKTFYEALERRGVRVAPGNWFGDSERVFRIGFGLMALEDTQAALQETSYALADALG
ncbi:MAG: pyridoxal phosphate-dependent aminotransferase [Gammaproteobacteria bacterium]|nr:pyridoxal phosphate-dependent aminotransferase [Gammaproteobacteria bacterium]